MLFVQRAGIYLQDLMGEKIKNKSMIFLIENFELFPFQMLHKSFASLHTEFQMFIFTPFILLTNGPCLM